MGLTADPAATARTTLGRVALLLGWVPLAALIPVALFVPEIPPTYRYLPLVASVLLFGMPHGAVDYVALPRARAGRVSVRGIGVVSALYLLFGGAYLGLWFLAPVPAAGLFILLTWFHWGQGDLYALRDMFGVDHVGDRLQQSLTVLVRGGLPMLVPLLGFPGRYREVLGTFVEPFGANASAWLIFEPTARLALGVAFAAVTLFALARGNRHATAADGGTDARRRWHLDVAETGLLWVYFLLVPPVLAVGVYFCLWHSVRHIARVVLLDGASVESLAGGHFLPATGKFALEAAVPTALALGLIGGLWAVAPGSVETLAGATGLYLVGIAVLTLPHTVVVVWMDREQGIWTVTGDRPRIAK
jgi:Brp/Blh family beta-carotene 15,15'-monooxygenase